MGQGFGVWSDQGKHEKRLQRAPGSARWECLQGAPAVAPLSPHEVRGRGQRPRGEEAAPRPWSGEDGWFLKWGGSFLTKGKGDVYHLPPKIWFPTDPSAQRERERETSMSSTSCIPHQYPSSLLLTLQGFQELQNGFHACLNQGASGIKKATQERTCWAHLQLPGGQVARSWGGERWSH